LVTPFVADARGEAVSWSAVVPIGVITIGSLLVLTKMLSAARARRE